jgi:allantoicase
MQLYYTKLMKVMKEGIYIGQNTYVMFFLGDHVYFETVYDDNGNPMEGFETGRPLYSTIDRYILICFERV